MTLLGSRPYVSYIPVGRTCPLPAGGIDGEGDPRATGVGEPRRLERGPEHPSQVRDAGIRPGRAASDRALGVQTIAAQKTQIQTKT